MKIEGPWPPIDSYELRAEAYHAAIEDHVDVLYLRRCYICFAMAVAESVITEIETRTDYLESYCQDCMFWRDLLLGALTAPKLNKNQTIH